MKIFALEVKQGITTHCVTIVNKFFDTSVTRLMDHFRPIALFLLQTG